MAKKNTSILTSLVSNYTRDLIDSSSEVVDVIRFAESNWGLNLDMLPVQRVVLKAFYGLEMDDTEKTVPVNDIVNKKNLYMFTEKEFMDYLIEEGRTNISEYKPGKERRELVLCAGRRGSKSTISSIIATYEIYKVIKKGNPQSYYGFPNGQQICVTSVATSDDQAQAMFDMIRGRTMVCGYLKDRIQNLTQTYFSMQTDDDVKKHGAKRKASINLLCGGSYSVSLRGRNNILVIFDEAAFFIENGGRFSGTEVYRALTPSIASFVPKGMENVEESTGDGKIVSLSSPYGKSGIFWELYNRSFDEPETMLMFKLYTALLNPTVDSNFLQSEYRRSKSNFMAEFGAEFSDTLVNWVDEVEKFEECIDYSKTKNPKQGQPHVEYYMGIDLGLTNDGTGITIVHREGNEIIVDWSNVYFSGQSDVWDNKNTIYKNCKEFAGYDIIPVKLIAEKIKELCRWFPIKKGGFDQFNGYSLMEMLHDMDLKQFEMTTITEGKNTEMYQIAKSMYLDGMLKLFDHPVLISELRTLEEEKKGRNIKVSAPRRAGFHDDISSSFVRAVYECYKATGEISKNASMAFGDGGVFKGGTSVKSYHAFHKKKNMMHGGTARMLDKKQKLLNRGRLR